MHRLPFCTAKQSSQSYLNDKKTQEENSVIQESFLSAEPFSIFLLDTRVHLLLNPFRLWFDSLFRVLFTFPSRYLYSIGFLIIFSLGSNSRPFFRQHYKADLLFWKFFLSLRISFSKKKVQNRTFTFCGCAPGPNKNRPFLHIKLFQLKKSF